MYIDLIVLFFLLFFIYRGARRGFFLSLAGPAAFVIAASASYVYYKDSKNAAISLAILLIGPLLLQWFFIFFLRSFQEGTQPKQPSVLSGFCGAAVTAAWGMSFILPIILVLGLLPLSAFGNSSTSPLMPKLLRLQEYVHRSYTFAASKPFLKQFNLLPAPAAPAPSSPNNTALANLSQDQRMQSLINDPQIAQAIKDKNYTALFSNPKILQLAQDPAFVQKLMAAYQQMGQPHLENPNQTK